MDPIAVVAAVGGIIFGVGGLYFGYHEFRMRQRKKLAWSIDTEAPLFTLRREAKGKFEVLYNRIPMHDAHLVEVKIKNQGRKDILPSDFVEQKNALKISLKKTGKVLEILEIKRSSQNFEVAPEEPLSNTPHLAFNKFFLPKGAWFSLTMIASAYQGAEVSAYIADCDIAYTSSEVRKPMSIESILLGTISFTVAGFVLFLLWFFTDIEDDTLSDILVLFVGITMVGVINVVLEVFARLRNL